MIPYIRKLEKNKFEIILLFLKWFLLDFKCKTSIVWLLWILMEFIWTWKIVHLIRGIFLNILVAFLFSYIICLCRIFIFFGCIFSFFMFKKHAYPRTGPASHALRPAPCSQRPGARVARPLVSLPRSSLPYRWPMGPTPQVVPNFPQTPLDEHAHARTRRPKL